MVVDKELERWIRGHEGYNNKHYIDTVGKFTIGFGRNIQDNGINQEEAELMFQNDLKRSIKELEQYSWYLIQPGGVKKALINMNFNLGINHFITFTKMIVALVNRDYTQASIEALDSKWAEQVGQRAKDIAVMIREGK